MQSTVVHLRVTKQPCYNTCIHQQEQDAAAFGNLKFMQQSVIFCSALRVNFVVSIGNSLCCQTACAVPCPSLSAQQAAFSTCIVFPCYIDSQIHVPKNALICRAW